MHQTTASVNALYARFLALHFRPIFDLSPPKTAEIRHFPSASAAKTVELQSSWVWPRVEEGAITLTRAQLAMLIEGLDWRRAVAFKDLPAPTAV
jgi:hypothetical protein